jgi:DNA polymerase elongation subunit (family B)
MNNVDYICYIDTDSLYINLGKFIENNIGTECWQSLCDEKKITVIKKLNTIVENHVNDRIYRDVQRKQYNSVETEFRIMFKQEIIAKSVLFVKKKKYSSWIVNEEGIDVDRIKTTGLEIVRSDTPEVVRPMLKDFMSMILKNASDSDLSSMITKCRKELQKMPPEAISTNIGIHDTKKYIGSDNKYIKGTPMHVKSVANYRNLLKTLKLEDKYEDIVDGTKAKIVYLKKNKFDFDSMAFSRWPKEFEKVLQIDYTRQIEKTFLNKCEMLLEVLGKTELLHTKAKENLGLFF